VTTPSNNGGPAFPADMVCDKYGNVLNYKTSGMTLRDYFAAKAMREMTWNNNDGSAKTCYEVADAMLKAREAK